MREAKLIITSENKSEAGIKSAVRDLLGIDDAAKKVGSALKEAFTVLAIAEGTRRIAEFGLECVKSFGEVDRTMMQLKASLDGNEASFERMTGLIGEMSGKTLSTKDEIEKLVAELGSLGRSDSEIDRITQASVALSNITGKGLNEAFTAINATFSGTSGKLGKLVPELDGLTKSQLEAGGAVELLNEKLGAISDAMGGGIAQKMHNLSLSVDDFKEAIGADLAPVFSPMIGWIDGIVKKWTEAIDEHTRYREALKKDAVERTAQENLDVSKGSFKNLQGMMQMIPQYMAGTASPAYQAAQELQREFMRSIKGQEQTIMANLLASPRENSSGGGSGGSEKIKAQSAWWASIPSFGAGAKPEASPSIFDGSGFSNRGSTGSLATRSSDFYDSGIGGGQHYIDDLGDGAGAGSRGYTGRRAGLSDVFGQLGAGSEISGDKGGIGAIFGDLIKTVGPLISSFSSVQAILNPLQTIFSSMMDVIGPLVNQALAPLVGILKIVGNALGQILTPIIVGLGKVINFIMEGILWVWNGIVDAINFALGWIPSFNDLQHATLESATAAGTSSSTTASGGTGASYTGAQSITFNFYNQGNVVGSGGLKEIAEIIENLIAQNARYKNA